jgi:hypothetical protein
LPKNISIKTIKYNPTTKNIQKLNRTLRKIRIDSRIRSFQKEKHKGGSINKNLKEPLIKVLNQIISNGETRSIIGDKKIWRKTVEAQKENGRRNKEAAHTERRNLIEMTTLREAKALIGKIMANKIIGTQVMNKEKSTEATSKHKTRKSEGSQKKDLDKITIREEKTNVTKGLTGNKLERGLTDNKAERGLTDSKMERGLTDSKAERGLTDSKAERGLTDSKMERGLTDSKTGKGLLNHKIGKEPINQITKWKSSILKLEKKKATRKKFFHN